MEHKFKYIPMGLLATFGIKGLILGLTWELVACSLVFAGLWYLLEYKSKDKELQVLSQKLDELAKAHKDTEAVLLDFRTSMSSLRMATGLKPTTFGRPTGT